VIAYAKLQADQQVYAGWPEGIPAGTSLGTFLGRQAALFCEAMGFDYLWLSNGLGYSHYPWAWQGETFDGERFGCTDAVDEAARVVSFWEDWRAEASALPLEVRGTNFPVGFDLASHAAPHRRIEQVGGLVAPPVNPPWGSRDLGMEMASYLSASRSCRRPVRFPSLRQRSVVLAEPVVGLLPPRSVRSLRAPELVAG